MTRRKGRLISILGMIMAVDGATFATNPAGTIRLWSGNGPRWYNRMMSFFAAHTGLCRALAVTELLAGTALVLRAGRAS